MLIIVLSVTSRRSDNSPLATIALVSETGWNQVPSCELTAPEGSWADSRPQWHVHSAGVGVLVLTVLSSHRAKSVHRLILTHQCFELCEQFEISGVTAALISLRWAWVHTECCVWGVVAKVKVLLGSVVGQHYCYLSDFTAAVKLLGSEGVWDVLQWFPAHRKITDRLSVGEIWAL